MYFPFVGLTLAVCWPIALGIYRSRPLGRPAMVAGVTTSVLLLAVMVAATWHRNEVWRSDESLWRDVTIKSPRNGRGLMNYGLTLMENGDSRGALIRHHRGFVPGARECSGEFHRGAIPSRGRSIAGRRRCCERLAGSLPRREV